MINDHPWLAAFRLNANQLTNAEPVRFTGYIRPGQTATTDQFFTPRGDNTFELVTNSNVSYRVRSTSGDDNTTGDGARFVRLWGLDDTYNPIETTVALNGTTFVNVAQPFFRLFGAEVTVTGVDSFDNTLVGNLGFIDVRAQGDNTRVIEIPPQRNIGYTGVYTVPAGYETFFKIAKLVGIGNQGGGLGVWTRRRVNPSVEGDLPPKIERYLHQPTNRGYMQDENFDLLLPSFTDVMIRSMEGGVRCSFELYGFQRQTDCNTYLETEL